MKAILHNFSLAVLIFVSSCTPPYFDYSKVYPHRVCDMPADEERDYAGVKVAVVLGGGGAKGMAHLGVLYELEAANIPIDMIVGCSAGSIVGAAYAKYPSVNLIKPYFDRLNRRHVFDISLFCRHSLCYGASLSYFLQCILGGTTFDELKIPLVVVATDMLTGRLTSFDSGLIVPAVHASSAIPLVYSPVVFDRRMYLDGGVVDPVPCSVASRYNPEMIIAVDVCGSVEPEIPKNTFQLAQRCTKMLYLANAEKAVENVHFLIKLNVDDFGTFDDSRKEELFEVGRQAAREMIPEILKALNQN